MDKILNKHKGKGYSFIELVVVLLVVVIFAVLLNYKWIGTSLNLDSQAALLASYLRYTQMMSMTHAERYRLAKASSRSYQVLNSTNATINSVTLSSDSSFGAWSNLDNNLVVFDSKGVPYVDTTTPGTTLNTTATIYLSAGVRTVAVTIDPTTGRIYP